MNSPSLPETLLTLCKLAGYIIYLLLMLPATIRRRSQQINRRKT